MGQCIDCPRKTDAIARCCLDEPVRAYVFDAARDREREAKQMRDQSDSLLLPIPGRSAARGEVTHKKFADMNRRERRAFNSKKSR